MIDQDDTEFPTNEFTFTITTSDVANVVPGTATIDMFCVLNTSATRDSYVGIYDSETAAVEASLAEQYCLAPNEQLTISSPFVSNVDIGVPRTVYVVASTPNTQIDEAPGVIVTPYSY